MFESIITVNTKLCSSCVDSNYANTIICAIILERITLKCSHA